jgi:D-arabinose 5-phosphate isomerase GutQ
VIIYLITIIQALFCFVKYFFAFYKAKGVFVITITENLESPLAINADVVLKQYVNRETDKYNMQGTTSTTALCMLFHALQAAMIEESDYQKEQFALIHPGGAVGKRLNNKEI